MDCPSCGRSNPDDARFCSACASPLGEQAPALVAQETQPIPTAGVAAPPLSGALDIRTVLAGRVQAASTPAEGHAWMEELRRYNRDEEAARFFRSFYRDLLRR